MKAVALLLAVGAAAPSLALTPTANPAEALDEAACVGLRLRSFAAANGPVTVADARIVPRDGDAPSHCAALLRLADGTEIRLRLPVALWTGKLVVEASEPRAAFRAGAAVAWGDAPAQVVAPLVTPLAAAVVAAYYGRPPD